MVPRAPRATRYPRTRTRTRTRAHTHTHMRADEPPRPLAFTRHVQHQVTTCPALMSVNVDLSTAKRWERESPEHMMSVLFGHAEFAQGGNRRRTLSKMQPRGGRTEPRLDPPSGRDREELEVARKLRSRPTGGSGRL